MYINSIYVDQVALAQSLADSVREPRNNSARGARALSRRRLRRTRSTGGNALMRLVRRLLVTGQSFSRSR
jgi:hypothetical protein